MNLFSLIARYCREFFHALPCYTADIFNGLVILTGPATRADPKIIWAQKHHKPVGAVKHRRVRVMQVNTDRVLQATIGMYAN